MVNKVDPAPSPPQAQGINPLLEELFENYPLQVFAAMAQISGADPSIPAKIATELLSKNLLPETPKLDRIITLLPTLKDLSPEAIKQLKMGERGEFQENSNPFSKESFREEKTAEKPSGLKVLESQEKNKQIAPQKEAQRTEGKNTVFQSMNQTKPLIEERGMAKGFELPMLANTIKEVLSFLSYFANHANTMKPESFDMFQKVMKPILDQLVRPVQKPMEGEIGSKRQEIERPAESVSPKERHLPLPSEKHHVSEKPLSSHKIENSQHPTDKNSTPLKEQTLEKNTSANRNSLPSLIADAKPTVNATSSERTALQAAPFSFQHSISTAPRRAKRKPKDPWEEEKEKREDEEDPFSR